MAKQMLLLCDRCGGKKNVLSGEGIRSDRVNLSVDLCESYWAKLVNEYGVTVNKRRDRRGFQVIPEADIPSL